MTSIYVENKEFLIYIVNNFYILGVVGRESYSLPTFALYGISAN